MATSCNAPKRGDGPFPARERLISTRLKYHRPTSDLELPELMSDYPTPSAPSLRVLNFRRIFSPLSESFIYDPIVEMRRRGVPTGVVCLVRMYEKERPFPTDHVMRASRRISSQGVLAQALSSRFGLSEADSFFWPLSRGLILNKVRRFRPDVIHAHFGPDGCLIRPIANELGIPLVVSFYGYDVSRLIKQAGARWRPRYRKLFADAHLLIGISRFICQQLIELGAPAEKVVLLHLGASMDRFAYRDPTADYHGGTVRCVHVGRLTPKKSPVLLVRAFARARELLGEHPQLQLDLVGDGELRIETELEIRRLGLSDQVRLLGALPHEKVAEVMRQAHIYTQHCVTAPDGDREGLGVSFVEASASGLPVVTTRHNGIPDVVLHNESGLLSEEGDVESMAVNLARIATQPERWREFGQRGREHVCSAFDLGLTVDRRLELLQRVVSRVD